MATILTTPATDLWPRLDPAQAVEAQRLIDRAELIVLQRFPTVPQRIAEGNLNRLVVAGVIEDMVSLALEKSERGGLDKLAYPEVTMEWETDGGLGKGSKLWLTVDELVLLAPPSAKGAFTIYKKPRPYYPHRGV